MKIFFDTEFTGLQKNTDLISIGMISEDGNELYIEFNDFDYDKCDKWIRENVLQNTVAYGGADISDVVLDESNYYILGKTDAKNKITEWLNQFEEVEFYSDVCHYDFVLFADLFDGAMSMPDKFPPCCHDINQDIARHYDVSDYEAFNISREEVVGEFGYNIVGSKHNALYDARVIKIIYENL